MQENNQRLRDIRKRRGMTLSQVAEAAGTTNQQISLLERGERRLTVEWIHRLASALHCEPEELLRDDDSHPVALYQPTPDEFTLIPCYEVSASAGHGSIVDQEHMLYHLSFRTDWLHSMTSAPVAQLAVIKVQGDSMQPTLSHNDTVMVDMTQTQPKADGIYVIVYDDTLVVKRVQLDPVRKLISIISDNPAYRPLENLQPDEIRIAGRVIWVGRQVS